MELEVGLKITKTRDDITSTSDFRIAKDRAGPVFLSRETASMFILTAHLTGYRRDNIYIKINEDGTEISISGEKPVQEKLMLGWIILKKEVEIKGFRKVFKIPHGVILDRIKAKYNQEESVFKIVMPKLVKGISGVRIEEVKEEGGGTGRGSLQSEADHTSNSIGETSKQVSKDSKIHKTKETRSVGEKMLVEGGNGVIKGDLTGGKHETSEEGIKVTELDQNVAHHFPSNIDETNKEAISEKTGESERTLVEANAAIAENKEPQIESVGKSKEDGTEVGKGGFAYAATKTSMEEFPQLVPETEDVKKAVIKRKGKEIECLEEKVGGEESKKMDAKPIMVIEKNITEETTQKGSKDPKIEHRHDDQQNVPENIGKGEFEAMSGVTQDFPKQIENMSLDGSKGFKVTKMEEVTEAMARKRTKESESFIDNVEGDLESKSMQKEANEVIDKNTVKEAFEDEIEDSKVETNGNQQNLQENIVKGTFELLETVSEEFPKQVEEAIPKKVIKEIDDTVSKVKEEGSTTMAVEETSQEETSDQEKVDKGGLDVPETLRNMFTKQAAEILLDGGKGSKETKGEETKEGKEESTKTESPEEEKKKREKIEKIHTKDIISKGKLEAWGTATEEFSKLEETKKVKGEDRKSRETEVVADGESTVEEETLQEAPERKHPTPESEGSKVKEVRKRGETEILPVKGTPKREVPHPKVVMEGFKEAEERDSKDKSESKDTTAQQSARTELDHNGEIGRKDITGKELPKQDFTANVKDEKPSERVDKSKVVVETMQTRPEKEVEELSPQREVQSKESFEPEKSGMKSNFPTTTRHLPAVEERKGYGEKPSKASATRPKATEEFEDVKPINQTEKSKTEEIPKTGVEPPEATVIHSKATNIEFMKVEPKGETDKEGTKELTSPLVQKLIEEPHELAKPTMKQDTAKAEMLQQVHKGKELMQCPSRLSSPPSTQQFEVEGKGKTEEYCEDRLQKSEMKAYQDVEQAETSKQEFPTDQQFIKDDQQVSREEERHEIEEVTANEQGDEASQDDLQESVEQKDLARGGKKDDKRSSNKFCATLIVAGSAILISLTVFFIRHKRATKSNNNMQIVLRRGSSLMRT